MDSNKPAPAPLPGEVDDAIKELRDLAAIDPGDGLAAVTCGDTIRAHISGLTRRVAEAEAERDSLKCEVAAVREIRWSDTVKNFKLLRRERESISYLNRIIRASLSGGHAALELLETERDKERHRAEAAEARVRELEAIVYRTGPEVSDETHCGIDEDRCPTPGLKCHYCQKNIDKDNRASDLEAFKARVMAWASERCICGLVGKACPKGMFDGETKWATSGPCPNWTPPQAWEVGE